MVASLQKAKPQRAFWDIPAFGQATKAGHERQAPEQVLVSLERYEDMAVLIGHGRSPYNYCQEAIKKHLLVRGGCGARRRRWAGPQRGADGGPGALW